MPGKSKNKIEIGGRKPTLGKIFRRNRVKNAELEGRGPAKFIDWKWESRAEREWPQNEGGDWLLPMVG